MNKLRIQLITHTDVTDFVTIANSIPEEVYLEDGEGRLRVVGKSMLGVICAKYDFRELWVKSDSPHLATKFMKFSV